MKFKDYDNYYDYVRSNTSKKLVYVKVHDDEYIEPIEMLIGPPDKATKQMRITVIDSNEDTHVYYIHSYRDEVKIEYDTIINPVVSPWFFIEHGGKW